MRATDPALKPKQPLILPRTLIFLSAIWIIGSWLVAVGVRPPLQPSSASYEPRVRIFLLCLTIGLMIGWPLLRLSQLPSRVPVRQTLLDLMVIVSLIQVMLWPIRLVTTWSVLRTAAMDATLLAWLLIVGAVVASATGSSRSGPRIFAMLGCIGICLLGPFLAWMGVMGGYESTQLVELSPLLVIHTLGDNGSAPVEGIRWQLVWILLTTGILAWLALWLYEVMRLRHPDDPSESTLKSIHD